MGQVLQKHFKTMTLDPEMKEAFPEGVQVGYKRYRNIKEQLCRARLYDVVERPQRSTALLLVGRNATNVEHAKGQKICTALDVQPQGKFLKLQI